MPRENRLNVEMKEAYHRYREMRLKGLAKRVLDIVGSKDGIVRSSQLMEHAKELQAKLMGPVYTYTTSFERKDMYHVRTDSRGVHPGVALASFVLRMIGRNVTFDGGDFVYHT